MRVDQRPHRLSNRLCAGEKFVDQNIEAMHMTPNDKDKLPGPPARALDKSNGGIPEYCQPWHRRGAAGYGFLSSVPPSAADVRPVAEQRRGTREWRSRADAASQLFRDVPFRVPLSPFAVFPQNRKGDPGRV